MNIFDKFFPENDYNGHSETTSPTWANVLKAFSDYAQKNGDVLIRPTTRKMNNFLRNNNPGAIRISGDNEYDIYVIPSDDLAYFKLSHMSEYTVY